MWKKPCHLRYIQYILSMCKISVVKTIFKLWTYILKTSSDVLFSFLKKQSKTYCNLHSIFIASNSDHILKSTTIWTILYPWAFFCVRAKCRSVIGSWWVRKLHLLEMTLDLEKQFLLPWLCNPGPNGFCVRRCQEGRPSVGRAAEPRQTEGLPFVSLLWSLQRKLSLWQQECLPCVCLSLCRSLLRQWAAWIPEGLPLLPSLVPVETQRRRFLTSTAQVDTYFHLKIGTYCRKTNNYIEDVCTIPKETKQSIFKKLMKDRPTDIQGAEYTVV